MKILAPLIILFTLTTAGVAHANSLCDVNRADFEENAKLSFSEFDQTGSKPKTSRALGELKCYLSAAEVSEQYLSMNMNLTTRERAIVTWHMAQYLASAGKEKEAAPLMLATLTGKEIEASPDNFDWNSYVLGSWAFIQKDRPLLAQSLANLINKGGQRNTTNSKVLLRFVNCFNSSYDESFANTACDKSTKP